MSPIIASIGLKDVTQILEGSDPLHLLPLNKHGGQLVLYLCIHSHCFAFASCSFVCGSFWSCLKNLDPAEDGDVIVRSELEVLVGYSDAPRADEGARPTKCSLFRVLASNDSHSGR